MSLFFDILTILIASAILMIPIKKLYRDTNNIMDICIIIFYIMQVFPLVIQWIIGDVTEIATESDRIYFAMTDEWVSLIYDILILFSMIIMIIVRQRIGSNGKRDNISKNLNSIKVSNLMFLILNCMIFLPLILGLFLAPDKSVYSKFSFFYMEGIESRESSAYLFHVSVMYRLKNISLLFILISYFLQKDTKNRKNFPIIIGIILCTWIEGKRGVLTYALIGILAIDYIKKNQDNKRIIKKAMVFLTIIISYFIIYNSLTGKGGNASFFNEYTFYFSRLNAEKLAIYDKLYDNSILQYPAQTIIYDLLFFVPRRMWASKPVMYCRYFTGYAYTGDGTQMLGGNLQVNIWAEYVSNFGIFGHFFALFLLIIIVSKVEKSDNFFVNITGMLFIFMYLMFGFESIVIILYVSWIVSSAVSQCTFKTN